jgi:hypothetical protein
MSARPHGTTPLSPDDYSLNLTLKNISKTRRENSVSLKSDKNSGDFTRRPLHLWKRQVYLFLECKMFWTKAVVSVKHTFYVQ